MKKALLIVLAFISVTAYSQRYRRSDGTPLQKPIAVSNIPSGMGYYYDTLLFKFRPFQSTAEVISFYPNLPDRQGSYTIYVKTGGTLASGVITGGVLSKWWFKNGTADSNLVIQDDYNTLVNKPTIPAAQVQSDWNASGGLNAIANKPTIPVIPSFNTINGQSIIGNTNITVGGVSNGTPAATNGVHLAMNSTGDSIIVVNAVSMAALKSAIDSNTQKSVANAYVETYGNDLTAQIGNPARPYLTIRAALMATTSYSSRFIHIGVGEFASPDTTYMTTGTNLIGSGQPATNSLTSISPVFYETNATKLIGGTILHGHLSKKVFSDNMKFEDFGIDCGSDWCTGSNGGNSDEGFYFGAPVNSDGVTHGQQGDYNTNKHIIVRNITTLVQNPTVQRHSFLLENCDMPIVDGIDAWDGFATIVSKNNGGTFDHCKVHFSGQLAFLNKASDYAWSNNTLFTNFQVSSCTQAGVTIDNQYTNNKTQQNVFISNGVIINCGYGIHQLEGLITNIKIDNVKVYNSQFGIWLPNVSNSTITNCYVENSTYAYPIVGTNNTITGNISNIASSAAFGLNDLGTGGSTTIVSNNKSFSSPVDFDCGNSTTLVGNGNAGTTIQHGTIGRAPFDPTSASGWSLSLNTGNNKLGTSDLNPLNLVWNGKQAVTIDSSFKVNGTVYADTNWRSSNSMTGYSDFEKTVSSNVTPYGTGYAWHAFDGLNDGITYPWIAASIPATLSINFKVPKVVNSYVIKWMGNQFDATSWTYEASNDGSNFTVLDTRSSIDTKPTNGQTTRFYFANTAEYLYYRFVCTVSNGIPGIGFQQVYLYGTDNYASKNSITAKGNNGVSIGTNTYDSSYVSPTITNYSNSDPMPDVWSVGSNELVNGGNQSHVYRAVDGSDTTAYVSFSTPAIMGYDFKKAVTINMYSKLNYGAAAYTPRSWTFEVSNDNANWTVLDTHTNVAPSLTRDTFRFANTGKYRFARINITATNQSNNIGSVGITEVKFYGTKDPTVGSPLRVDSSRIFINVPVVTNANYIVFTGDSGLQKSRTIPQSFLPAVINPVIYQTVEAYADLAGIAANPNSVIIIKVASDNRTGSVVANTIYQIWPDNTLIAVTGTQITR